MYSILVQLYARINARVEKIFEGWFTRKDREAATARVSFQDACGRGWLSIRKVSRREEIPHEEVKEIETFSSNSKRQYTWFNLQMDVKLV